MRSELALALVVALAGCAGSVDDPAAFGQDCSTFVDHYVAQSCGTSCHNARDQLGQLDLQTQPVAPRLIGVPGSQPGCDTHDVLSPEKPEQSLLYLKLASDHPPCGRRMPLSGPVLTDTQLACVLDWIQGQSQPVSP